MSRFALASLCWPFQTNQLTKKFSEWNSEFVSRGITEYGIFYLLEQIPAFCSAVDSQFYSPILWPHCNCANWEYIASNVWVGKSSGNLGDVRNNVIHLCKPSGDPWVSLVINQLNNCCKSKEWKGTFLVLLRDGMAEA